MEKQAACARDARGQGPPRGRATAVVKRLSLWSGAAGLIPIPLVDSLAVGGVQIEMLRRISKIYDVPFSQNSGKALIAGIAGTMIPASSGIGATSLIKGIPGIGTRGQPADDADAVDGRHVCHRHGLHPALRDRRNAARLQSARLREFLKAETGQGRAGAAQSV